MRVLTLNRGSSSLKVALFDSGAPHRRIAERTLERVAAGAGVLDEVQAWLEPHGGMARLSAIGHRIVHGGPRFDGPALLTPDVLAELGRLAALDPMHLPTELALVEGMSRLGPALPQVACFDTAFHRTMPREARLLAIPRRYEAAGVQRYGFHGLSYAFLMRELSRVAGESAARGRVVLAHLGSGSSLAAVRGGRSIDTTMGFTPAGGVMMGTRSGDLDPGVLVHIVRAERLDANALEDLVNRRSGLLGVSETSADVRDLLACEAVDPRAADALALYCYQIKKTIGALAASLGGIDTLVFSGGIGEHAAPLRVRIAAGLEHLGVRVDPAANDASAPLISPSAGPCAVRVMHTDEESMIAEETFRVALASPAPTRTP